MILTLLAVSLNDQPLSQPITARFDDNGGTIGRADHNTMALPDPERHISRLQAEIVARGDGHLIRNVGAANPIIVSGRSLAAGESTALALGDELRIGGYLLRVEGSAAAEPPTEITLSRPLRSSHAAPPAAWGPATAAPMAVQWPDARPAPVLPPAPPPTAAPLSQHNPFADLLGPAGAAPTLGNPFADLLGPADAAPPPGPLAAGAAPAPDPFAGLLPAAAGVPAGSAAWVATPPPAPRLPDDFDPFAPPPPPLARAMPAAPVDPFADLGEGAKPRSLDQLYDLGRPGQRDALADFMADAGAPPPGPPGSAGLSTDPLLLFGGAGTAGGASEAAPAQPDHLPAINAAFQPPRPVAPVVAVPAAAPIPAPAASVAGAAPQRPAPPGTDAGAAALWAAFCQGAGIDIPLPPGGAAAAMQALGQILHSAVAGTLQLMAVRASTKHELRANVTIIQPRSNNPLKFSPDAKSGIEQLVQPAARGFLEGPAAMEDAMHDLVGHSIGTVAGMRAAIEGMLDRFDPAALEAQLSGGSVLDNLLPGSRRARLWDLYLQHHRAIREEAQDDFHTLFGKAFLAAYEQQIERLKARPPGGPA